MSVQRLIGELTEPDLQIPESPTLAEISNAIYSLSRLKGDWINEQRTLMKRLSEVATALGEAGDHIAQTTELNPPKEVGDSLAQAVASILDIAEHFGYDLEALIAEHHESRMSRLVQKSDMPPAARSFTLLSLKH